MCYDVTDIQGGFVSKEEDRYETLTACLTVVINIEDEEEKLFISQPVGLREV